MNTLTETEKAYLAGLIDGEGCIFISKYRGKNNVSPVYNLRVIVAMSEKEILEDMQKITGAGRVHYNPTVSKKRENWSEMWQWITTATADVKALLDAIYPYLRIKKSQADTALQFIQVGSTHCGKNVTVPKHITEQREYFRMKLMNQKTRGNRNHVEIQLPSVTEDVQVSLF